jgi:uncharacterized membrane protein
VIAYVNDWVGLVLRWFHVTAAIAWIGESFYFVMLDRALMPPPARDQALGLAGEFWSVHGGGFYHARKFLIAPPERPDALHWSKWKSYATWLSGAAMLGLLYLLDPKLYLIDPSVAALPLWAADGAAVLFLGAGWFVYDLMCRAMAGRETLLAAAMLGFTAAAAYLATHVFSARAAFLLTGAMLATIMSANVLFVIIPGQRLMVASMARGETPDPVPGLRGKQRSVHNTYFTLPVVFAMISNHAAFLYGVNYAWLVLTLIMLSGALVRQFFVLWHAGQRAWIFPAASVALILALVAWLSPSRVPVSGAAVHFAEVEQILHVRCAPCHAAHPTLMASAPQGVMLDTPERIISLAPEIEQQAVRARAMPLGNVTGITEAERAILGRWIDGGTRRD